ncbi:DUF2341 domain-containing protein, partial [Candidatus Woesearchaeota archaeon]
NTILVDATSYSLNNLQSQTNLGGNSRGTVINATKPFNVEGSGNADDMLVPVSWAGMTFVYTGNRDTSDRFCLLSPWGTASVDIYDGALLWQSSLVVDGTGTCVSKDFPTTNATIIMSDIPILVFHDGAATGYDGFPAYPSSRESLYGPSLSTALYVTAGQQSTTVTIVNNSGDTSSLSLSANTGSNAGGLMPNGQDGGGPAVRLSAPVALGAIQQADSDGAEASVLVPEKEMSMTFGSANSAEYVVAVSTAPVNCTLYTSSGKHSSNVSVGANGVHKLSFGVAVNPGRYITGPWKMVCSRPVWAYYEEDANGDETTMFGEKQMRQYTYPAPVATSQAAEWAPGLSNRGATNFTGYLRMQVQNWTGTTWANILPPVVDQQFVSVPAAATLDIASIWSSAGGWDTSAYPPGWYRVRVVLEDPSRTTLTDSNGNAVEGFYNFTIIEPTLIITNLTYENENRTLREYETGDTIDWINVTVSPRNNTAYNTRITLDILDATLQSVGWGPDNETQSCGTLAENATCERQWNNASAGYAIPYGSAAGDYVFYWNITMDASNAQERENHTLSFILHDVETNTSSELLDTRVFRPNSTLYTFNISNPWSKNITGVNVTINCPSDGFECNDTTTGLPTRNFGQLNSSMAFVTFNVSVNSSVPSDNYLINVTLSYKNPGGEFHNLTEIAAQTLEVRFAGLLAITDNSHPPRINRSEDGSFSAFMNNTGDTPAPNAWLAYTLPSGWSVTTGALNVSTASLAVNDTYWNNLTALVGSSAGLGPRTVRLDSAADDGRKDFITYSVIVYANTTLTLTANQSVVDQGDTVLLTALLRYDNGTALSGENVSFGDETAGTDLGWNLTNSSGEAIFNYTVPGAAALGLHTLNASYAGSTTHYTNPRTNTTTIRVNQRPVITGEAVVPNLTGIGQNVTFSATITDDDAIDEARYTVVAPNGTVTTGLMTLSPPSSYSHTFTSTWLAGDYTVTITANDTDDSETTTTLNFTIIADIALLIQPMKTSYGQSEEVNITFTPATHWWNSRWPYRAEMNVTNTAENLSEYQVYVSRNLGSEAAAGKIETDCADVRFTWYNTTAQQEEPVPFFTSACALDTENNASFWVKLPFIENDTTTNLYLYYGNPNATDASNSTATFTYR